VTEIDETHDPALTTWVPAAQSGKSDFPVQNLPFGAFRRRSGSEATRIGIAIGDSILDIVQTLDKGLLEGAAAASASACRSGRLNELMGLGRAPLSALRLAVSRLLRVGAERRNETETCLVSMQAAILELPVQIGDFTDFFTSINHAINAGRIFNPDRAEPANFRSLPIAYHGRASTVSVSGTALVRPHGQIMSKDAPEPIFSPSRKLDFEVEVGAYIGLGNGLADPVQLARAREHIFGICLVNDWSARDIQAWESLPLGPFLAKSSLTTVSPWIVTLDALAPFHVPAAERGETAPPLMRYLDDTNDRRSGGLDIRLEVLLSTARMREKGFAPARIGAPNFRDQYWTLSQMLTHHTSNGCALKPGDLIASGTVSGPSVDQLGCLLELTRGGSKPFVLPNGESRTYLEDDDEVIIRGRCERDGFVPIGFGECRGLIMKNG
jgi:fumarylacetoacetase